MTYFPRLSALALTFFLLLGTSPRDVAASPLQEAYADLSDSELDALVAPIALYPDALVAQVLGASTFPDQVVEADNFLKNNPQLSGSSLEQAVEQQDWDPAIQALTQFPSVLEKLARNISWTSALGDAAATQQEDTLAAVQRLRGQAYASGNLKSGSQIKVVQENPQVIVIQPANPQVVYVPAYNPTLVYGRQYVTPGYSTGDMVAASIISFGAGVVLRASIHRNSCGYGWYGWGLRWGEGNISCGGNIYYGNPYWWGGYHPGYRPGYRPPYYPPPRPPRPPRPGRPSYPGRPPGGRPPVRPPNPGKPPVRPPNPGKPHPGRPNPGIPGRPNPGTLPPRPTPGRPSTLPVAPPSTRPAPVAPVTRPSGKDLRGYPQAPAAKPAPKPNAFSGNGQGRPQSARGNRSVASPLQPKAAPSKAAPPQSAPRR